MGEYRKCPFCGKCFETELTRPDGDTRPIQEIFPDAPTWEREQLISGCCSQACWEKAMGLPPFEATQFEDDEGDEDVE